MTSPSDVLAQRFQAALTSAFGDEYAAVDPVIRPSHFADFQANASLPLAKRLGRKPREVAETLVGHLTIDDVCLPPSISGPGFINLTLRPDWVAEQVDALTSDRRLGVPLEAGLVIPIDYSAPNVAKEMHVGHLRTTVVGDALARTLEHLGHRVVRQNHVGDWGTPFGMLIEHLRDVGEDSDEARSLVDRPNDFYQAARAKFDASEEFAVRSRQRVVALQAGDGDTLRLWHELVELSTFYFNTIYQTLGVTLTDADLAGESSYNDVLPAICDELESLGVATVSEGALCVFLEGFTGREGKPVPLIIRKSDGGFGYATTDLATVKHRVQDLHADRILYVIGAPQHLHLQMVFETARKAGWLPPYVDVVHVQIGNVLGADGKILKTRSGAPVRLMALLDEAVDRAAQVLAEARPELDEATRSEIARDVGIGAVKYADLSVSHDSEYTFDFDRMLALTGNTGPYLQYAAARIRSMLRKAGLSADEVGGKVVLGEEAERSLALALLGFGNVVEQVGRTYEPHRLCAYLFDVAQSFTTFYEHCPVLRAEDPDVRASRLALSAQTLRVLVTGLDLLGIRAPDQM
ncbi:MAG: arginine--tRNA ligase [Nocardioidaceae bacterium]